MFPPTASVQPRRRWLNGLLPAAAVIACATACAAPALIDVQRDQTSVRVLASATLHADAQTVWDTLVGYERLPEFIPDMRSSRTLSRDGPHAVVEQHGRAGLGFMGQDFALTLAVHEVPLREVDARAVAGDFSRFEASYRLSPGSGGGTRLDYAALIEPRDGIPAMLGVPVMRRTIQRQFAALVAEIERRASARAR